VEPSKRYVRVSIETVYQFLVRYLVDIRATDRGRRQTKKNSRIYAGKGIEVSIVFWGLTLAMLMAAIAVVVVPLAAKQGSHGRLSIALIVLVPAIAAGFYGGLGSPDAATAEQAHQNRGQSEVASSSGNRAVKPIGSVASMLEGLRIRLENEPGDGGDWLLLAKSYQHLGQTEDADAAYQRARSLGKNDPALEQSQGNVVSAEVAAPVDVGPALRGQISLAPDAAALVEPGDTVFIFAKESMEQRMPVVAVRKPAKELPIRFVLTDRDVMVSGTTLAQFEQLVVTAKISRSGLATEVVEGLEVWSDPVSPLDNNVIELLLTAATNQDTQSVGGRNE